MASRTPTLDTVPWHAWGYHYIGYGRCYPMWAYWQSRGRFRLPRGEAVKSIVEITGLTPQQGRNIIRRGEGVFWFQHGRVLHLQHPANLRRRVWRQQGVAKRAQFLVPLSIYRETIGITRAFEALPVVAPKIDDERSGTPRSYTAKCLGMHVMTVSRFRHRLRQRRAIETLRRYRPAAPDERDLPQAFQTPDGRWHVRLVDIVRWEKVKIVISDKHVSLRDTTLLLEREEKVRTKLGLLRYLADKYYEIYIDLDHADRRGGSKSEYSQLRERLRPRLRRWLSRKYGRFQLEGELLLRSESRRLARAARRLEERLPRMRWVRSNVLVLGSPTWWRPPQPKPMPAEAKWRSTPEDERHKLEKLMRLLHPKRPALPKQPYHGPPVRITWSWDSYWERRPNLRRWLS